MEIKSKIKKIANNLSFRLMFTILLCSLCHSHIKINTIRFFLTISVLLQEVLMLVLPFLVFSFIAAALSEFRKKEKILVLWLMPIVFLSGFFHVFLSGLFGYFLLSGVKSQKIVIGAEIVPFFQFKLTHTASIVVALIIGIGFGVYNSSYKSEYVSLVIYKIRDLVMRFMKGFFIPLLPVFIGGFFLKLFSENQMKGFIGANIFVFFKVLLILLLYYIFWLFLSAKFKIERTLEIFRNIFPAILTAFATMSSAVTLPLSLEASEKNTKDRNLSGTVMPLTLSFHLIGDTLLVPIMCMIVLLAFNCPLPTTYGFAVFSVFFIMNQFAGAGVPNATIMILIPVLTQCWGYSDVMVAFTIAFYAIVEPISTVGNVAANNILMILFHKLSLAIKKGSRFSKNWKST